MHASLTLFQKIYAGEIPAEILYKDEKVFVIKDISPKAKVHLLIIPIEPIPTAADLEEKNELIVGRMFIVARKMAENFGIAENGYRLIVNCREWGGQEVPHLHMHLLGGQRLGAMVGK